MPMRFYLKCEEDGAPIYSVSDLTLSQTIDEIINHLASGYKVEAGEEFASRYPFASKAVENEDWDLNRDDRNSE
jgi:hypothetical protein